ncbi:hypothetical protein GCM10017674_15100 [Streptomyces gardneri]|uniref:Uncharacterized protein n=1 Tax=Streptomyces gardneri TaxID=66892 RepID=A0A4Y3RCK1_9ACTN|nr:hypothetical protein SGA01_02030 [Streptomyces gardneri]GHG88767.1 hypothetical protein GCM10017674_15100 [Streptomyces gardneri]
MHGRPLHGGSFHGLLVAAARTVLVLLHRRLGLGVRMAGELERAHHGRVPGGTLEGQKPRGTHGLGPPGAGRLLRGGMTYFVLV